MKILITGPQGSGKTTHAQILAQKLYLPVIDAGEMLRELAEEDSADGRSVKEDMEQGKLVEDKIVANLMRQRILSPDCQNGFVVDGYPRTLESLELFDPQYNWVFYLQVSDEEVQERLLLRGREDDKPELIRERLMLYHQMTEPVLGYYLKKNKLIRIDAHRTIEEVAKEIAQKVNLLDE